MALLRFKINPYLLLRFNFDSNNFSKIISEISIGPAFKTTGNERHNTSDDIIYKYIENNFEVKNIADIGVSDGTSALYLIKKLEGIKNTTVRLYDKYTHLNLNERWYGYICSNQDNKIVYIKFFCLLFFVYPFNINSDQNLESKVISFDNPLVKKIGLNIDYFDVFETKLQSQVNFIKCANILNPVYFSPKKISSALKNLHGNLLENGYLFIIHNTQNNESLLILKKSGNKMILDKNIKNSDIPKYIGVTDCFIAN